MFRAYLYGEILYGEGDTEEQAIDNAVLIFQESVYWQPGNSMTIEEFIDNLTITQAA